MQLLKSTITILLVLFIGACAKSEQTLATSKKAKLVTELIINNASCSAFKNRLALPSINDNEIERVYFDALKASCIHKDV